MSPFVPLPRDLLQRVWLAARLVRSNSSSGAIDMGRLKRIVNRFAAYMTGGFGFSIAVPGQLPYIRPACIPFHTSNLDGVGKHSRMYSPTLPFVNISSFVLKKSASSGTVSRSYTLTSSLSVYGIPLTFP